MYSSRIKNGREQCPCRRLSINLLFYKNGVWGEAPSKVAGAAAPDNKPLPEGKGFGDGVIELNLLIKI